MADQEQACGVIFVEGVPFTGKSTLSEALAEQARLNGVSAEWLCEGAMFARHFPHHVETPIGGVSLDDLRRDWNGFFDSLANARKAVVVDSAISFAGLSPLIALCIPAEDAVAQLIRLMAPFAQLRPRVIHMVGNPEQLVPDSIAERGPAWQEQLVRQSDENPYQIARGRTGAAGAAALFREEQDLMHAVLAEIGWPCLTLDCKSREDNLRASLDFIGLREFQPNMPRVAEEVMRRLEGEFRPESAGPLEVRFSDERLWLYQDTRPLGLLVAESETRYRLPASGISLEFSPSGSQFTMIHPVRAETVYRRDNGAPTLCV